MPRESQSRSCASWWSSVSAGWAGIRTFRSTSASSPRPPRPGRGDRGGPAARGPVPPLERRAAARAGPIRAARGHPRPDRILSRAAQRGLRTAQAAPGGRRPRHAPGPGLARQRASAAQCGRAHPDPGRGRSRSADHRRHAAAGGQRQPRPPAASAPSASSPCRCARRGSCSKRSISTPRSCASAATSPAPPPSSAWSGRLCIEDEVAGVRGVEVGEEGV